MYVQGGNKTKVKSFVTLDTLRKEGFNMKIFKAYVINKDTKKGLFIESEYKTKRDFINDLRKNNYKVNEKKVFEKSKFDFLLKNTDFEIK